MRRQQTKLLAAGEIAGFVRTQGPTAKRAAWRSLRGRLDQDHGAGGGVAAE